MSHFDWMCSMTDLLDLLNCAKREIYGEKCFPFTLDQLNYYCSATDTSKFYNIFEIPKKRGGNRLIASPCKGLKVFQKCLNLIFKSNWKPSQYVYGFTVGKSIADNAAVHIGQRYVYSIDLKDFFPSIHKNAVVRQLIIQLWLKPDIAEIIANLCCLTNRLHPDGILPQGAPTSPILSNMECWNMDFNLSSLNGVYYSRYADDITFSCSENIFTGLKELRTRQDSFIDTKSGRWIHLNHIPDNIVYLINNYINLYGFRINQSKVRLRNNSQRCVVTGLTVNKKVNVAKRYVKQLRTLIHNWELLGHNKAQEIFIQHYKPQRKTKGEHHIENIISGKLSYLKMVKGESDPTYRKLYKRFDLLTNPKTIDGRQLSLQFSE